VELVEVIGLVDMAVEGMGVELGQHIDPVNAGVDAVADGNIDQAIFSGDGYGWFGA
jgi:hypothetical protein